MKDLTPKDHAEAVATFRHAVIGPVCARDLSRGELMAALREIAQTRVRPPASKLTKMYSVATLERWLYAFRRGGLPALRPRGRSDRGRGRELTDELRQLICDIRREHPSASARLIVRTLEADGRLETGTIKPGTVRKLLHQEGLDRLAVRDGAGAKTRLRWQAAAPDALWHADVCHGPTLKFDGVRTPLRIHGMLDDCSRFVLALEAHSQEREEDMLRVLIRTLRLHGKPDVLYLDNGSTYRGDVLRTACSRLGISLLHARPYDPEARGKMERFWLTLISLLENYLPKRYQAAKARVVDSHGRFSDQIDVVVFDRQYSPFIFTYEGQLIIPAESVYAAFEAKQTVDAGYVTYAQKKVASVRRLHRTSLPIPYAKGTYPAKQLTPILGGLLSLESEWSPALGPALLGSLTTDLNEGVWTLDASHRTATSTSTVP